MRATIAIALLAMTVIGHPCSAADAPLLKIGMAYAEARQVLLALGWLPTDYSSDDVPITAMDLDDHLRAEFLKRGAPEVGSCLPTGLGQCFAIWRRQNRLLVVESRYEGYDPRVGPDVYFFYQVRLGRQGCGAATEGMGSANRQHGAWLIPEGTIFGFVNECGGRRAEQGAASSAASVSSWLARRRRHATPPSDRRGGMRACAFPPYARSPCLNCRNRAIDVVLPATIV